MVTVIVITPAVMVINVIWWTKELHTKYYFFVANLLATDIVAIIVRSVLQYLIAILYLLGLNSDSNATILQFSVLPLQVQAHLTAILTPCTLAVERMIVIGFPYRHRSIMTTRTVISILTAIWGLSTILTIVITFVVPYGVVWPLASINHSITATPFFAAPRLLSAVLIIVANIFLQYEITVSNRKAKENERLGNEKEAKRFKKIVQLFHAQAKSTITLLIIGGIDVIGNITISFMFAMIKALVEPNQKIYIQQFLMYPLIAFLYLSHPLVYGLYMKKIRRRLPKCVDCQRQWNTKCSRVVTLHHQH